MVFFHMAQRTFKIAVTKGDGIGPEVVEEAMKILHVIQEQADVAFEFTDAPAGGAVWKKHGVSLPEKSWDVMKQSDAILFGALGLPGLPPGVAEYAILQIRQGFDEYVNLRPAKLYPALYDKCPLKPEYIGDGIEFYTVRENTEGLYVKIGGIKNDAATNVMLYTRKGCERIIRYAFDLAIQKKFTKVTNVDKANILDCSMFWREIFEQIGKKYKTIQQENYLVDAFCQWLIRKPYSFEVVVTDNLFGDIISDEAAFIVGSLGMAASGNICPGGISMYEPIHGSAPDIAGQGIANPIGSILSNKIMLEETCKLPDIGASIEQAVEVALAKGRTPDIQTKTSGAKTCSTREMGDLIASELTKILKS
ncbi:MAG: 3-isopropylmalate dehydrogenase [Promethearchaeota archaeon CR_4]|nr:MAG: 3-isopropylmalate dehydrogenase [Candidatus Lokiarchaeota archaeon CR_4]